MSAGARPEAPPGALWWLERQVRRHYAVLVGVVGAWVLTIQLTQFGTDFAVWDWLLVSGFAALLVAGYFALLLPDRAQEAVTRLVARGVLTVGATTPEEFLADLHRAARRAGAVCAPLFAVVIVGAFVLATGSRFGSVALLAGIEAVGALPVGLFVGRAFAYGRLGRRMTAAGWRVVPDPRHLDGAAGLLPIGDLYFFQARLLAVPAAYLTTWWFLIPLVDRGYERWRDPYVGLLAIVVLAELLVFVLPMIWFHHVMADRKRELSGEADKLSGQAVLAGDGPDEGVAERYAEIEAMPVWPVDAGIRRRFGFGNLVLLVPVIAQLLGASESTQDALDQLSRVITGQS